MEPSWSQVERLLMLARTHHGDEPAAAPLLAALTAVLEEQLTGPLVRRDREDAAMLVEVLRDRALRMAFQPVVRLGDATVVGYEALARFDLAAFPSPADAFAAAARCGLGVELELLAIERAFECLGALPYDTTLGINLSGEALMTPAVQEAVRRHAAGNICVEVTEHTQVPDYPALHAVTDRMRAANVLIAVDDAGAGFAGEVGARLVAEGIEIRAEHDKLRNLGVDFGQGYYLAKPGPLPD